MKVLMPSALLSYTGTAQVEAGGASVGELFEDLDARFPGLRFRAIDEQGRFRRHIRCFVNGVQIFDLDRALVAQDEIVLVQALSGG
jgi:molybdopterin converting factor small subunit